MNTRLKTRTDYHVFHGASTGLPSISLSQWLKPVFWVIVGCIIGMSYNKKEMDSCYDLLAFSNTEKQTVVAQQIEAHPHAKANVSAKS